MSNWDVNRDSVTCMPLVTVVIPTFRRMYEPVEAIQSVLRQDYCKIEIIVVDDNADYPELRAQLAESMEGFLADGRVKLIVNSVNLGGALSRNKGIEASSGDLVAFLDDDDVYASEKISKQVTLLQETDADVVYCYSYGIDGEGKTVWKNANSYEGNVLFQAMTTCITNTSTLLCKKQALLNVGLFDDIPCKQDVLLELKLAATGCRYACVKEFLVAFNENAKLGNDRISVVSQKTVIGFRGVRDFARKHYDKLTKAQMRRVEVETAYKVCNVAFQVRDLKTYSEELLILFKYWFFLKYFLKATAKYVLLSLDMLLE